MQTPSVQQEAVFEFVENGRGSLSLKARAGCGKTTTLIEAAKRAKGTITFLAFNKSISKEIEVKLEKEGIRRAKSQTVHAAGLSAWRKVAPKVQVDGDKMERIVKGMSNSKGDFADKNMPAICQLVSYAKQSAFNVGEPAERADWEMLVDHFGMDEYDDEAYVKGIIDYAIRALKISVDQDNDVINFDDMIYAPLIHNAKIWQTDWVLLDEAQDTNEARRLLAIRMMKPGGRLIAVGDDRQAIYGFTGADANAMDMIKDDLNSHELYLTVTYRCPKTVVAEANKIVPDLMAHETAPEGEVRELPIKDKDGKPWFLTENPDKADVIICRNTRPLIQQAYDFIRNGIGCRVEGRDIGEGLIALAKHWKSVETLNQLSDKLDEYKLRETKKWLDKGQNAKAQAVEDKVETLKIIIENLTADRKNSIEELVVFVRSLFGDTKAGETPKVITLSTIHKSKGREWNTVYLLDRFNTLPSKYAVQPWQKNQEENLEYVAITRSKRTLVDLVK